MLFSALFTYAADHVPARVRTQGLALFGVSGILPIALGGVIGDILLARADYAALFLASLVFSVVSLGMSFPLPEEVRDRSGDEAVRGLRAALMQRDLVPLWWIGTVFSIAVSSFFIFIKRFVDDTGVGTVGLFFSMYTAAALFLRIFLGWLPDRLGPKRVLGPALVTLAAGCACMAIATNETTLAVAGLLCGIGHGFTFPILFGLVVTRAPEANRGTCMAVFTALFDVGVLVGGPSLGWLVESQGFAHMYLAAGALTLLGSASFFALDARRAPR
jgi:MFS family permease